MKSEVFDCIEMTEVLEFEEYVEIDEIKVIEAKNNIEGRGGFELVKVNRKMYLVGGCDEE